MSQSKKPKPPPTPAADSPDTSKKAAKPSKGWNPRDGLGIYIESPETNPEGRVLEYDDDFVVITDKYPKARSVLLQVIKKSKTKMQH
jgi:aprataxin